MQVHVTYTVHVILRDPGAARGDDVILSDERYFQTKVITSRADKSLATYTCTLTKPVPEVFKKYFCS